MNTTESLKLKLCLLVPASGVSVVEVQGNQSAQCSLVFSPTQVRADTSTDLKDSNCSVDAVIHQRRASKGNVFPQAASYDFDLPLMVNGARWPTASPSPPPTPSPSSFAATSASLSSGSRKPAVRPLPWPVAMATPQPRRVQATGGVINELLDSVCEARSL